MIDIVPHLPAAVGILGCVVLDRACSWRWGGLCRVDSTGEIEGENIPPMDSQ